MALDIVQPQRFCRRLRSKGMFIEVESGVEEARLPSMSDGFVWCTHTQNCLGPDGRVASREVCLSDRQCFEL